MNANAFAPTNCKRMNLPFVAPNTWIDEIFVNAAHTFVCLPSLCYCSINSASVRRRCLLSIYLSLAEWIQCAMHIAHRLRDALSVRLRSHFRCVFWPSSRVHAADVRALICVFVCSSIRVLAYASVFACALILILPFEWNWAKQIALDTAFCLCYSTFFFATQRTTAFLINLKYLEGVYKRMRTRLLTLFVSFVHRQFHSSSVVSSQNAFPDKIDTFTALSSQQRNWKISVCNGCG